MIQNFEDNGTPRFYTQLWTGEEFERHKKHRSRLRHAVSNQFRKRGLRSGDFLYVWSFLHGHLYLLGRMHVPRIFSTAEARKLLETDDLISGDHVVIDRKAAMPMRFNLEIEPDLIRRLRFDKNKPPTFKLFQDEPDPQTFRGVRELTPDSAAELDQLLGLTPINISQ